MSLDSLIPSIDHFFEPTLTVLKQLGGSGTVQEIYDRVCASGHFSEAQQSVLHKDGPQTEIAYRLAWARTSLKQYEAIENVSRGVWALTPKGQALQTINQVQIKQFVAEKLKASAPPSSTQREHHADSVSPSDIDLDPESQWDHRAGIPVDSDVWIEHLLSELKAMAPDAFERLCQRVLRQSGFIKVEVTGKTGDGGIDGIGVLKMALLSFPVFFQCKRYAGSVGASAIRDFRGAMVGRTDKGLFVTTGTFTSAAKQEATRDGAPALDLIDGEQLCILLKDLKLGVETKMIEVVTIHPTWFSQI
ncbi:restriction endonuclease [Spirulina major CS-329]|uniref:restriction endonuclease n=1 Tax=Spirulina TaxID=1154 RepID=UPI002330E64F|nr:MULTISPECIES: restriction endonuclease [Spirulina]MDB9494485.1 restriction endonuclease [Spirulina subsalsa CS-330]MDB9503313.1 restriction endonuclease [Spirulina major CS-329]